MPDNLYFYRAGVLLQGAEEIEEPFYFCTLIEKIKASKKQFWVLTDEDIFTRQKFTLREHETGWFVAEIINRFSKFVPSWFDTEGFTNAEITDDGGEAVKDIIIDSAAAKAASVEKVSVHLTARIKCNFYNEKRLTKQQRLASKYYSLMKQQLVLAMAELATLKARKK